MQPAFYIPAQVKCPRSRLYRPQRSDVPMTMGNGTTRPRDDCMRGCRNVLLVLPAGPSKCFILNPSDFGPNIHFLQFQGKVEPPD